MFGFIFGAVVGIAGYWAYLRYIVGNDDDAFADFDTGPIDRPTSTDTHGSGASSGGVNPSA